MLGGTFLPFIFFTNKMITTKTMTSKKIQVAHVNKGDDKIVITQSTHSTSTINKNGNLKQHVAHFVKTCNNASTESDLLVKQFVQFLRGNAFNWYTDLALKCIDSWNQIEHEFLNHFYNT
ncbi:hypothetical protein PVL29_000927 [Vitis rotundifolia]|uniref:Retrotransposon gag protein n=1 Tax=Vitis rotundifolia TaxID=103349 RepID=A0AA39ANG1_VITRO|nr:hypothetical protein PVL29_000927 [Vitis rotundifolia]